MQPIIKRTQIQLLEGAAQLAALPELDKESGAAAEGEAEGGTTCLPKSARLVRVDGQVRAIEFQCSCGELTLLELEFSQGEGVAAPDRAPAEFTDPPPTPDEESP